MKTILLAILLFLTSISLTHADDLTIISSDAESSDVVEVLIRGKGSYCSLWMDSLGSVENTDCIRLTNSKKIKILCTKKKKICKTETEIYEYLKKVLSAPEEETIVPECKNEHLNHLALSEGTYSWFTTNSEASLKIKKNADGLYTVKGEVYSGIHNQYGPKIGEVDFTAPIHCGTLFYKDRELDYSFRIKIRDNGSFDVDDEGEAAAYFSGHFMLNASRSIVSKKEKSLHSLDTQSSEYKRVYFDNLSIFPMDYYNKNIKIQCGLGGTQMRYVDKGEITEKIDGFVVDTYCELEKEIDGNSYMKDPFQVLLLIPNTSDGRGKKLAKYIRNNEGKLYMMKGIFVKLENLIMNYPTLIIEEIEITGNAPATSLTDLFK